MPDIDDMPDPIEETYVRAEEALDDEAARAARRAKVLAAVTQGQATPPASAPGPRVPFRRYGGWLAAACVAGISVITAQQVWRSAPERQPSPPPAAKAPAPASQPPQIAAAPTPAPRSAQTAVPSAPASRHAPPPAVSPQVAAPRGRLAEETAPPPPPPPQPPAPPPPPAALAPPPPLPLPPVEKPIRAPVARAFSAAPAPPPPPVDQAKGGAAPNAQSEVQSVVVTGSRIARRDANAPPPSPVVQAPPAPAPLISGPLKAFDGPSRLREAAAAGQTADILTLLDQGVPVDAADADGETPLMRAVEANQLDAVVMLRRHGASLDLKNRSGVSVRDMAARKNDLSLNAALDLGQ